MKRPLLAHALSALVFLALASPSAAAEWNGFTPGVSSGDDLLIALGDPTSFKRTAEALLFEYRGNRALSGAIAANFHVDRSTGKLVRIDVTPSLELTTASIQRVYGPSCVTSAGEQPCYVSQRRKNATTLTFRTLGIEIDFDERRDRATLIAYVPVARDPDLGAGWAGDPSGNLERSAKDAARGATADGAALGAVEPAAIQERTSTGASTSLDVDSVNFDLPGRADVDERNEPTPLTSAGGEPANAASYLTNSGNDRGLSQIFTLGGSYVQRLEATTFARDMSSPNAILRSVAVDPTPPALLDGILNITPGPTFRGYLLARLTFDPLADPSLPAVNTILDQLWFRWELDESVFFTIGRQHVKWGQGAAFRPTDFLRPVNPTPLERLDLRPGIDALRVQVPIKRFNQNLFALVFIDTFGRDDVRLRKGAAIRAEQAFSLGEVGLSAIVVDQRKPRFGGDFSLGLGAFDVYGEVAALNDRDTTFWQRGDSGEFESRGTALARPSVRAVAGALTRVRWLDIHEVWFRIEGAYNELGYEDRAALTWVQLSGDYQPLFHAKSYALFQVSGSRRSPVEPSLSMALLANLHDRSGILRVDFGMNPLVSTNIAAFLEVPLGHLGGEFRFRPDPSVVPGAPEFQRLFSVGFRGRIQF